MGWYASHVSNNASSDIHLAPSSCIWLGAISFRTGKANIKGEVGKLQAAPES